MRSISTRKHLVTFHIRKITFASMVWKVESIFYIEAHNWLSIWLCIRLCARLPLLFELPSLDSELSSNVGHHFVNLTLILSATMLKWTCRKRRHVASLFLSFWIVFIWFALRNQSNNRDPTTHKSHPSVSALSSIPPIVSRNPQQESQSGIKNNRRWRIN